MEGSRYSKKRITGGENHPALIKISKIDKEDEKQAGDESKETSNKFVVDYSKTGKAKCRECKVCINQGDIRIGKHVPFKKIHILHYFHLTCAFNSFKRARVQSSVISKSSNIGGRDNILSDERQKIEELIEQSNSARSVALPEKIDRKRQDANFSICKPITRSLKQLNVPSIKMLFTNADQLTSSKMAELQAKVKEEKPLIIAVSEVKPKNPKKEYTIEDFAISGYSLHSINLGKDFGRGIVVYTHNSLDKSITQISMDQPFEEICCIEVRLRGSDVLLFCCCYRSPTHSASSDANNENLNNLLRTLSVKKYSHRCIVGDFNFRQIKWQSLTTPCGENSTESKFIETVRDSFLHQHVSDVTRSRGNNNPSLIDLIFSDEEMQVSGIQHHSPLGKSDHSIIIFDYHCYLDYSKPKETFVYKNGDYNKMLVDVRSSGWFTSFISLVSNSGRSIDESWNSLKSELHRLRSDFVPIFRSSGKPTWNEKGTFPVSKSTRDAIQMKRKCHRTWITELKSGNEPTLARLRYNQARNKVKHCVRRDKRNFERNIAVQVKENPKAFWSHARRKLKTKHGIAPLLADVKKKDSLKFEDKEKADILQSQFSSVFTKEPVGALPEFQKRCAVKVWFEKISADYVKKKLL